MGIECCLFMAAGIDAPRVFMPKVDGLHGGRVGPRSRTRTAPERGLVYWETRFLLALHLER